MTITHYAEQQIEEYFARNKAALRDEVRFVGTENGWSITWRRRGWTYPQTEFAATWPSNMYRWYTRFHCGESDVVFEDDMKENIQRAETELRELRQVMWDSRR